jgi:hypothetical protein
MGLFGGGDDASEDAYEDMENYYTQQAQISAARWKEYQELYAPIVRQMSEELQKGPQAEEAASRASADVMQSFGKARQSTMRNLARYGIDPRSGAGTTRMTETDMGVAATEAFAKNRARDVAEQQHRARSMEFAKMGQQIPGGAVSGFGAAGTAAGAVADKPDYLGQIAENITSAAGPESPGMQMIQGWMKPDQNMSAGGGGGGSYVWGSGDKYSFTADGGMVGNYAEGGMAGKEMPTMQGQDGPSGAVQGPGGPVDDQIQAEVPDGSYVIPSDVVEKLGVDFFDKLEQQFGMSSGAEGIDNRAKAMLSNGEYVISPEVVKRKGKKFFDDLIEKYHKPSAEQSDQYQQKNDGAAMPGEAKMTFAHGGKVPGTPQRAMVKASSSGVPFGMKADGGLSQSKAKEMLRHGSVRGRPLTKDQKGYFGAVAGGNARKADGGYTSPEKKVEQKPVRDPGPAIIKEIMEKERTTKGLGSKKKTRRGGKKRKMRYADGGPAKHSREWYKKHGLRPEPGQVGPAPKKIEGQYGKDKEKKSPSVVSGFGQGRRAKARREAAEGYEGEK